jgi:predicted AAA+ superfamily ATPase
MPSNLAERLSAARRQRFVGRDTERSLFESALSAAELPFYLLHVYGPGGVGKTTLLKEMATMAEQARARAIYLDARNVDVTPNGVIEALRGAMNLAPADSPVEALKAQPGSCRGRASTPAAS